MDRVLRTLVLAVLVGAAAWAVLRWPHLDTVETGRTPEYPELRPRDYIAMPPDLDQMLANCDAALLIGDPALQVDRSRYITLDLAEEWIARTSKSFVFAFWAIRRRARDGQDSAAINATFKTSRDHGLRPENLETIVQDWTPRLNLSAEHIRTYLTHNIHYYLDPPSLDGLRLFYRYGAELGVLPESPELKFA